MSDDSYDWQNQDAFGGVPADIRVPQDDESVGGTVASIGSAAVFQRRTRRTLFEIEQDEVVVRKKGDCGIAGTKTYVANRIAATRSLSIKFLGSYHLLSKNANGENVQKSKSTSRMSLFLTWR